MGCLLSSIARESVVHTASGPPAQSTNKAPRPSIGSAGTISKSPRDYLVSTAPAPATQSNIPSSLSTESVSVTPRGSPGSVNISLGLSATSVNIPVSPLIDLINTTSGPLTKSISVASEPSAKSSSIASEPSAESSSIASESSAESGSMASGLPTSLSSFTDYLCDNEGITQVANISKDFWPNETINTLVQKDIVRALLNRANKPYEDRLVEFILNSARKLFTIMASVDTSSKQLLNSMEFCYKKGYQDGSLSPESEKRDVLMGDWKSLQQFDPKFWKSTKARAFCEKRWKALVPVFSTSVSHYSFRGDTILPFREVIEQDRSGRKRQPRGGAFSTVRQVEICEGYYTDDPGKERPLYFALKEIRPPEDERTQVDQLWLNEADLLRKMNEENDEHILRFITAFTHGDTDLTRSYYLMFEWADGGSLEDVWKQNPHPVLNGDLVKDSVQQLFGLAEALSTTHNVANIRHGDLKPENILRFRHTSDKIFGTLKIGDWGLAKYHVNSTVWRAEKGQKTSTQYSTRLYEPPEVVLGDVKILGRQFDVWSMGCIILELIIWLLYGYDEVERFRRDVQGHSAESVSCYEINSVGGLTRARLRPAVVNWIEHISQDKACAEHTAMGELMTLIKTRLLIVELPKEGAQTRYVKDWDVPSTKTPTSLTPRIELPESKTQDQDDSVIKGVQRYRATSVELVKRLDPDENGILDDDDRPADYWFAEPSEYQRQRPPAFNMRSLQDETGHLLPGPASSNQQQVEIYGGKKHEYGVNARGIQDQNLLDDEWEIHLDNDFAEGLVSSIRSLATMPELKEPSKYCNSCQNFNFESLGFTIEYEAGKLEEMAKNCDLCKLLWETYQRNGGSESGIASFKRVRSSLMMNGVGVPVLSICKTPESKVISDMQIGLPKLPEAGSPAHFGILRQWLQLCDDRHSNCRSPSSNTKTKCMPTRLIDVGEEGESFVRLWDPGPDGPNDLCEYIALSHPWGEGPHFVTTVENLQKQKDGILVEKLPATFRDAISTTRALGKQYLWIDSICIIQGRGGDFEEQAKKMETVFSSAYCVLVASRAFRQSDGFLGPRRERDYVALRGQRHDAPFYICENIDNFDSQVLNGHLNKRGWVLQEHALARRSIFFTDDQTYFECGDGVRCETLTKMRNNLAAFLGDPNFPCIIMSASQGEKIIRFQNLYKTYSGLAFTNAKDRPIAVDGIQSRLLTAFGTPGGFGVFDDTVPASNQIQRQQPRGLLRRSLLWYRPPKKNDLIPINFTPSLSAVVPSWSWMAYIGEIDFLKPVFGNVIWKDLRSPWSPKKNWMSGVQTRGISLSGKLSNISYDAKTEELGKLFFDHSKYNQNTAQCVVLGVEQTDSSIDQCYFILVTPANDQELSRNRLYRRVGAGYLPSRFITSTNLEIEII